MYYVILCDDWCSVIPVHWVHPIKQTFRWPPKPINTSKAITQSAAAGDAWLTLKYHKILGPYTYEMARKAEAECTDISTSDETQFSQLLTSSLPTKRLIKKPRIFGNSSDSELSMSTQNCQSDTSLPAPSYVPRPITAQHTLIPESAVAQPNLHPPASHQNTPPTSINIDHQPSTIKYCTPTARPSVPTTSRPKIISISRISSTAPKNGCATTSTAVVKYPALMESTTSHANVEKNKLGKRYLSSEDLFDSDSSDETIFNSDSSTTSPSSRTISRDAPSESSQPAVTEHSCCDTCRVNSKILITLTKKVNTVISLLNHYEPRQDFQDADDKFELLSVLPLTSVEAVRKLDKDLQNSSDMRKQLKLKVSSIGGRNPEKHVRNALSYIFNDEVARSFSWTGRNSDLAVKNMIMTNIIIGVVLAANDGCTISILQSVIQEWFRHAGDRVRAQLKA